MTFKSPFDFNDMMKMFDPDSVARMFDPRSMMAAFEPQKPKGLDLADIMENNKRNFEAVQAANKAAAAANKDFYEKQVAIFNELMKGAAEQIKTLGSAPPEEIAQKQAQIYGAAVEQSLAIMTELADTTRRANEDAFASIQDRVERAVKDLGRF